MFFVQTFGDTARKPTNRVDNFSAQPVDDIAGFSSGSDDFSSDFQADFAQDRSAAGAVGPTTKSGPPRKKKWSV